MYYFEACAIVAIKFGRKEGMDFFLHTNLEIKNSSQDKSKQSGVHLYVVWTQKWFTVKMSK